MNLYLLFPIVFAVFVFSTILICNYRTFKIERYVQSKIKESTVLDIFYMTSIERKVGLVYESLASRKKKNLDVVIEDGNKLIKFFRTNHKEQEWEGICARHIQQAIDLGFSQKSVTTNFISDHKTKSTDFEKLYKYGNESYNLSIHFDNEEITLINPGGWKFISPEYHSIKPLLDNFRKSKNQFKKIVTLC